MNHIHIEIKQAFEKFSEAAKILGEAIQKEFPNEPEERYYELIDDGGYCDDFVRGKIYPLSDPILTEFGHKLPIKHSIDWRLRTKQDYLNQELLEKAKRDYCEGVVIKSFCDNNRLRIIAPYEGCAHIEYKLERNGIRASNGMNTVGCDGEHVCSNPLIYENGKWAEIIRADQSPTLELDDFKKDLNNLLEKYSCNVK